MKRTKVSILLLILLLGIAGVFHATLPQVSSDTVGSHAIVLGGHHEDTEDYCMHASDVKLSLNEVLSMDDEQLKEEIIRQSKPLMLYRINGIVSMISYEVKTSDLDISQFKREASENGMPVTYNLPSVTEGLVSQLQILVYVVDDTTPDSSSSTDPSSSTEPSSTPDSSSTTESSSTTTPSTSTGSTPASDAGNALVGRPSSSTSSSSSSQSQSTTEQSSTTGSSSVSDEQKSSRQSTPELGDDSSNSAKVAYSDNVDSEESQAGSVAKTVATASLGAVNGLMAVTIVSDIRVILWYIKLKR